MSFACTIAGLKNKNKPKAVMQSSIPDPNPTLLDNALADDIAKLRVITNQMVVESNTPLPELGKTTSRTTPRAVKLPTLPLRKKGLESTTPRRRKAIES